MAGEDWVGVEKEVTFDTYVAPTEWINAISETFSGEHQTDLSPGMFFSTPRVEGRGRTLYNGAVRAKLTSDNIGHFLRAMMGPPTTVVLGAPDVGAFEHTFKPQNGIGRNAKSATVVVSRSFGLEEFRYTGFSPSRLSFEGVLDQDIRYTAEGPANLETLVSPVETPAITTLAPFNHHDSNFKLGGTPSNQVRTEAWTLEIAADTEMVGSIGDFKGRRVHRSAFSISGRVDEDFDAIARYQQYLGNDTALTPQKVLTAQNVEFEIDNGVPLIGGGGLNAELTFTLPKVKFFSAEATQEERNRIVQGTMWTALFDDVTNNFEMSVLLRNKSAAAVYA